MEITLDKTVSTSEGVYVTHSRAKQRSDKRESKFLIPRAKEGLLDFAFVVERYLTLVRDDLGKTVGKILWTGKHDIFLNSPMGKNMTSKVKKINIIVIPNSTNTQVPLEMAKFLHKENDTSFTFHSFRRTSATLSADSGASAQQMQDFFGWKNPNMTMEYISTSKAAIQTMANNLNPTCVELDKENTTTKMEEAENKGETCVVIKPQGGFPHDMPSISNNQKVIVINGDFYGTIL